MRRVAWRSVRSHVGQFTLTTLAVVLGAAFLSGTLALRGVLSDTFSAPTSSTLTADLYVTGEPLEVRVVGEISYGASMVGANIVGMDPSWLMPTIAPDGRISSISIHLSQGAQTQQVCDEIRALLSQGERVQTRTEAIDEQNEAAENILGSVQTFLLVFVVLAVFVGSFIIMSTFAMSVRQRVKEFALLRAIGASTSSVFAIVIFQAVVVGVIAAPWPALRATRLPVLRAIATE